MNKKLVVTVACAGALALVALVAAAINAHAAFPGEPGRVAFMSDRSGNWDIYKVKQNGKGTVQLTDDPQPTNSRAGPRTARRSSSRAPGTAMPRPTL
jgi:hypothetical protein